MQIKYTEGPPAVTMGAAGPFRRGESKEVPEDLAAQLLAKKTIVFTEPDPGTGSLACLSPSSDPSDQTDQTPEEV